MQDYTDNAPLTQEEEAPAASHTPSRTYHRPLPRLWWGLGIGLVLAVAVFILNYQSNVLYAIVFALFAYTFGASLTLEDSAVRIVMAWMATRSVAFPGLIWEFSLDGFIWLIAMKLLFWVIGVVAGILFAIIGVILGILVAPFAYPFNLVSYIRDGD